MQVIGVPDERLGEQLAAWIRLRDGETSSEEEIRDFCRGQASASHVKFVRIANRSAELFANS